MEMYPEESETARNRMRLAVDLMSSPVLRRVLTSSWRPSLRYSETYFVRPAFTPRSPKRDAMEIGISANVMFP